MKRNLLLLLVLFFATNISKAQVFSLPYSNDFESGSPGWISISSPGNSWQLGSPNYGYTNSVHSGSNCWDVNLLNPYTNNADCDLVSPEFSVVGSTSLRISFWQNRNVEANWDGVRLEYASDSLGPWSIVGSVGAPFTNNWYTSSSINSSTLPAWDGNSGGWVQSQISIPNPSTTGSIRFRFKFTADASVTMDGFSIDDFHIEEADLNVASGTVYLDVNGNNIIDAGDTPLPNIVLSCTPNTGGYFTSTDSLGNYAFFVGSGVATTITPDAPIYSSATPANYTITLVGTNQLSSGNDFLITYEPGIIDAGIYLSGTGVRPGTSNSKFIQFYNQGTSPVSGTIELTYDPLLTVYNSTSAYNIISPTVIEFTYSNLIPGETRYISTYFNVDSAAVLGNLTTAIAIIYPVTGDTLPINNYDTLVNPVVNSLDPNEILVEPAGDITIQDVTSAIDLNYTINFQNTGTAEAFHVNIFNVLDNNLDLATLEIISSSHPLTSWNVGFNRQLQFTFANINLPDSNTNEPASHGFVRYRIKPLTTLPVGSVINNQAAIVFDFNAPVITNSVATHVIDPTGLVEANGEQPLLIYPNPNTGSFYFSAPVGYDEYCMINSLGQKVSSGKISHTNTENFISISNNSPGLYLLMISGSNSTRTKTVLIE